jgi:hypothetical protein
VEDIIREAAQSARMLKDFLETVFIRFLLGPITTDRISKFQVEYYGQARKSLHLVLIGMS